MTGSRNSSATTGSEPRRTRIAEGIYTDAHGLAATVKVGRIQREKRFPRGTSIREMQRWRESTRLELYEDGAATTRGYLQPDVDRYLERYRGRAGFKSERSHLSAWVTAIGNVPRGSLTSERVAAQLATWQADGVAALTCLHRWRALRALYRTLDGPRAKTPCDDVPRPKRPRPVPLRVPIATLWAVAKALERRDAKTHARFLVLASTGQRPSQLMRATPDHVDLRAKTWAVSPGKGGTFQYLHLTDDAVAAWRAFMKADAWGEFDTGLYGKRLHKAGWPADIRPYNVRHTLAMDLLDSGADLSDVQTVLGHASIQTTRTNYAGIAEARVRAALARIDGRMRIASRTASRATPHRSTVRQKTARSSRDRNGPKSGRKPRSSGR